MSERVGQQSMVNLQRYDRRDGRTSSQSKGNQLNRTYVNQRSDGFGSPIAIIVRNKSHRQTDALSHLDYISTDCIISITGE